MLHGGEVQSVLLYAAETWTPRAIDMKALEAFHMKCQRQLSCRSAGNSSSEMTRLQRPPACRRSRKSSATVVAPSSVTLRDYIKMSRRTRPSTATSTCPLVDHPTTSGNVVRADYERDGSIRSGRTMESPRRICGGVRRVVVTEEQRPLLASR